MESSPGLISKEPTLRNSFLLKDGWISRQEVDILGCFFLFKNLNCSLSRGDWGLGLQKKDYCDFLFFDVSLLCTRSFIQIDK
jgi:hypothetical protein